MSETPKPETPPPPPPPAQPQMPPEMQRLMRQLIDECASLVFKVATCRCNHKDTCTVFLKAQKIAEIIDKIQELRPVT